MSARLPLLAELKRRKVLRVGVLYIGATWALSQGISQLTLPWSFRTGRRVRS